MVERVARNVQSRARCGALQDSPIYKLRDLQIERRYGSLLVSGIVSSYYHKQLAQELIRAICRHLQVDLVSSIRVQ